MHENHASIVALHRLKPFFKKSAETFASTQYIAISVLENHTGVIFYTNTKIQNKGSKNILLLMHKIN